MSTASPPSHAERYAGLLRRLAAYTLDCLLLFAGLAPFHALIYRAGANPILSGVLPATGPYVHLWVFATASLPILLYFWFSFRKGRTPGMRLAGIHVTSTDWTRLPNGRALVRAAVLLIPFELNHAIWFYPQPVWLDNPPGFRPAALIVYALLALYLALPLLNAQRQSAHDLASRSVVVREATEE